MEEEEKEVEKVVWKKLTEGRGWEMGRFEQSSYVKESFICKV